MAHSVEEFKWQSAKRDAKRAQVGVTFELLPKFFGFNEDVNLRSVHVDYARNIVYFGFAGDGLTHVEELDGIDLTSYEGCEACEIIPPAWRVE